MKTFLKSTLLFIMFGSCFASAKQCLDINTALSYDSNKSQNKYFVSFPKDIILTRNSLEDAFVKDMRLEDMHCFISYRSSDLETSSVTISADTLREIKSIESIRNKGISKTIILENDIKVACYVLGERRMTPRLNEFLTLDENAAKVTRCDNFDNSKEVKIKYQKDTQSEESSIAL